MENYKLNTTSMESGLIKCPVTHSMRSDLLRSDKSIDDERIYNLTRLLMLLSSCAKCSRNSQPDISGISKLRRRITEPAVHFPKSSVKKASALVASGKVI